MTWTVWNLIVQVVAGIFGAHAVGGVVKEYGLGLVGHTIAGAIGGGISGYFLQTLAITMVTASGSLNEPTSVENAVLQGLAGIAAGGALTLIVGFVKHGIDQHKSQQARGSNIGE